MNVNHFQDYYRQTTLLVSSFKALITICNYWWFASHIVPSHQNVRLSEQELSLSDWVCLGYHSEVFSI